MKLQSGMVVPTCAEFFRYYAGWCSKINGTSYEVKITGSAAGSYVDLHAYTLKEPYGVVGLIFPWNGPIFNACAKVAPALAAGCSSLVKPAEETPLSALLLDKLIRQAGVPEGVVNLVTGYGHTAGAAISAHPDVEKVAFTGSTEVGKMIVAGVGGQPQEGHARARRQVAGADLRRRRSGKGDLRRRNGHLRALRARDVSAVRGFSCSAASTTRSSRALPDVANFMKYGGPDEEGVMSGPLISAKQLDRVLGFIDEGKRDGAEVVTGGYRLDRKGYFVHPTVLTNVDPGMRLYQEEIFGPVVSIIPFDDEDEAIAMANDTTYGLAGTVWTTNISRGHRLVKRLQAGSVQINCQLIFDHDVPFGGYKQSGWGHEFGKEGLEGYLKTKSVWAQL